MERKPFVYLYRAGSIIHLMVPDTFEQIEIDASIIEDAEFAYIKENQTIAAEFHGERMTRLVIPPYATVQVKRTDSTLMKGENMKMAELTNGRSIKVAQSTQTGDWVRVQVADEKFMERVPPPTDP